MYIEVIGFGGGWYWLIVGFKHYINFIYLEVLKRKVSKIKLNSFLAPVRIHRKYSNSVEG